MRKGMKVWWIDPSELHGEEHSSGEYTIVGLQNEEIDEDTIIYLTNEAGSEAEVLPHEIQPLFSKGDKVWVKGDFSWNSGQGIIKSLDSTEDGLLLYTVEIKGRNTSISGTEMEDYSTYYTRTKLGECSITKIYNTFQAYFNEVEEQSVDDFMDWFEGTHIED